MSKAWPMVPLGEVLTQNQEYIAEPEPKVYPKLSVKLYGKGVVLDATVHGSSLKMRRHQIAKSGQVILSEIWGKKGAIGFVPPEGDGALCTSHFFLFDVCRPKIELEYLQSIFMANYLREQLDAQAKGTTGYAAVRPKHLLAAKIPLPPLSEQRRIVARIEEVAAKIEEARSLRSEAMDEVEALWASDAQKTFKQLAKSGTAPLRDLVTLQGGGTPSKADPTLWEGSIPWICPRDMKGREIRDSTYHISDDAIRSSPAKLIEPGSVLIVVRGMILAHTVPSAVLRVPGTINQDMKALIPREDLAPDYLCHALWALNNEMLNLVERSTHDTRRLETHKLLDFAIPVPPQSERHNVVAYLDSLQTKADELRGLQAKTTPELDALLPSILTRAFAGEL